MSNICFNRTIFFIFFIILIVFFILYDNILKKHYSNNQPEKTIIVNNRENNVLEQPTYIDKLKQRDLNAYINPLYPPNRRLARHLYPNKHIPSLITYPSRGEPDSYHYYGNLINWKI